MRHAENFFPLCPILWVRAVLVAKQIELGDCSLFVAHAGHHTDKVHIIALSVVAGRLRHEAETKNDVDVCGPYHASIYIIHNIQ